MLLRSSSTPVIGSLLASYASESPNIISNHSDPKLNIFHQHTPSKFSFHQPGSLNISHNSSPISHSSLDLDRHSLTGFPRAQSDGNLEGLVYASCDTEDQFFDSKLPNTFSARSKCTMLQAIPSLSLRNSGGYDDDEDDSDVEYEEEEEEEEEFDEENVERVSAMEGKNVSLEEKVKNMSLTRDVKFLDKIWNTGFEEKRELASEQMYLARGLGFGGGSGGGGGGGRGSRGGGDVNWDGYDSDGGDDNHGAESQYKKLVEENPGNPLFLRNYAQFLYQTKRDLHGADEYYSRAILADPNDGEVMAQYARLTWELHHDQERALSYYERAVQAAPQDSYVHAAYAGFLWEVEEDEDEAEAENGLRAMSSYLHEGITASASA